MTAPVPDPRFRDQLAGAVRAVDSATTCPICGDRRTSKLDLGIHVADDHPAAEVEARVQAAANQRAAEELRAMADVFDADAKHLIGGEAYAQAAEDCRTRAAALDATPDHGKA